MWACGEPAQALEALQPKLQAWIGRMGMAADALVGAAQPAGAGRWDIENKVGVEVTFGQDGASAAPLATEPSIVWLDLLLPQVNACFCTQSDELHPKISLVRRLLQRSFCWSLTCSRHRRVSASTLQCT